MTTLWRRWRRRRDRTMLNSAAAAARVVLILALAVLIQGHWEDAAHHDRSVDLTLDETVAKSQDHDHHDHHHHHHGRNPGECEKQGGNCVREHGVEAEGEGEHHPHEHENHGESHAHSHLDHDRHGEPEAHSHSQAHSEDHHHDHGDESLADSHPHSHSLDHGAHVESYAHSHNEHAHHNCPHADHHHHDHHGREHLPEKRLLEKLGHGHSHAEEEIGFQSHSGHHHEDDYFARKKNLTSGVWLWAMGCSLLVSLASLVCLLFLPLIVTGGKPSRTVVDALAGFGAGCMLGDALLHQLPHAFSGGGHSHSHSDHGSHDHHSHEHEGIGGEHAHGHSLQDLSVGLAVLAGILLFFLVEKIVRRTEELSVHGHSFGHSHHHHRVKKDDEEITQVEKLANKDETSVMQKDSDSKSGLRKRNTKVVEESAKADPSAVVKSEADLVGSKEEQGHASNFVLSYLNLFSDGVHNFTDGMALGSAFLLHGTVGGWSRTLFLLAHELPQEVGDFGILLRSGFGVFEALAFNFLSALMALAGTALALLVGGNPGHSSLIEGFTAGGFIYIAVGAVIPDMHSQGNSLRTTLSQLAALSLGMGAAILISLAE